MAPDIQSIAFFVMPGSRFMKLMTAPTPIRMRVRIMKNVKEALPAAL